MTVHGQVSELLERLRPSVVMLAELTRHIREIDPNPERAGSRLVIVRHLDEEEGEEEDLTAVEIPDGRKLERLPGQHQLLGWVFEANVVEFLHTTGAILDVDEYG